MRTQMLKAKDKLRPEAPAVALERWNPMLVSAKVKDKNTLNIYSTIGDYGDGQGTTPKMVSDLLAEADGDPISVNVNSPGGDFFDGLAIHSLLSEYDGEVEMNIIGMAASAASLVALAGDTIRIASSGFFMIHKAWSIAIGNSDDFSEVSAMLAKFDESASALYASSTGMSRKDVMKMMSAETWISADEAISQGFAHELLGDKEVSVEANIKPEYNAALRKIDVALAKAGMPRASRRDLIKDLMDTPRAAKDPKEATPGAGDGLSDSLANLLSSLKQTE